MKKKTAIGEIVLIILSAGVLFFCGRDYELTNIAKSYIDEEIATQSQGALKLLDFSKQNGVENEMFGQKIYTLEYRMTLEAQEDFWKTSQDNFLLKDWYWSNFQVLDHGSRGGWDDWSYNWKSFQKGHRIEITGEMTFEKTDNGWRRSGSYENKTSRDYRN